MIKFEGMGGKGNYNFLNRYNGMALAVYSDKDLFPDRLSTLWVLRVAANRSESRGLLTPKDLVSFLALTDIINNRLNQ